ncbi:aminoglycoside phosphotransferase family protein [bacterium]|nr:aminoglycoside phosphotransferase family protein [bacterium]
MEYQTAADQFKSNRRITTIQKYGSGNVNDTFLVTTDSDENGKIILQKVSTRVFKNPELISQNMRTITEHISCRMEKTPIISGRRWETPRIIKTYNDKDFFIDSQGGFWRAFGFIESTKTIEKITTLESAREAGFALGMFQNLISDLSVNKLNVTLKGFHVTPAYLEYYENIVEKTNLRNKTVDTSYCDSFIKARKNQMSILEKAKKDGLLRLRPIHGDPKISNILFDENSEQAVSIIDLDTVNAGLIHYDIGDCLRSCCNVAGEEVDNTDDVDFDIDICKQILKGYLEQAGAFLTKNDYLFIYDSVRLITFELGLRFFTDYLRGNIYFKTTRKYHNLKRALVQFKLVEKIELLEKAIKRIIKNLTIEATTESLKWYS